MKIYVAASMAAIKEVENVCSMLRESGFDITSTWHREEARYDENNHKVNQEIAERDFADINAADLLFVFAPREYASSSGGYHTEIGYALGKGMPIVYYGKPCNVFHHLSQVATFDDNKDPSAVQTLEYLKTFRNVKVHQEVDNENNVVDHPQHYQSSGMEAIDVIEAFNLGFNLGNAIKYILRYGKKDPELAKQDLQKAVWYLNRETEKRNG